MNPPSDNPSYSRTTITVPRQLKRRMKAVRDAVNWSAVACEAFAAKLAELAKQEECTSTQDVVERLRKLKSADTENASYREGAAQGRRWAMNTATPDQLERLDAFRNEMSSADWKCRLETKEGCRELIRRIDPSTAPGAAGGRGRERAFWRDLFDPRSMADIPSFFRGFAEGAIAVWRDVRDQL